MRVIKQIFVLTSAVCCGCFNLGDDESIKRDMIRKIVEFDASRSEVRRMGQTLAQPAKPAPRLIWEVLGQENLSTFLLTTDIFAVETSYQISVETMGNHPKERLLEGKSLVSLEDVQNLRWPSDAEPIGSFEFQVPGLVSGRCLFRVASADDTSVIDGLWIPRKRSDDIAGALPVFVRD